MSIEGGIKGDQRKITCPKCGKVFTAWRPDTAPGAKVKCYFCKTEVEDDASRRPPAAPPAAAPAAAPAPKTDPAPTETPS